MHEVTTIAELSAATSSAFFARLGVSLEMVAPTDDIPASYWGAPEAGVVGTTLYARRDTPVHSLLHTACHIVVMDEARRATLHTDCGGSDAEEAAMCYLQCLLAEQLPGYSREQLFRDMDAWGYSYRLGSARRWFHEDAEDARAFLLALPLSRTLLALVAQR